MISVWLNDLARTKTDNNSGSWRALTAKTQASRYDRGNRGRSMESVAGVCQAQSADEAVRSKNSHEADIMPVGELCPCESVQPTSPQLRTPRQELLTGYGGSARYSGPNHECLNRSALPMFGVSLSLVRRLLVTPLKRRC